MNNVVFSYRSGIGNCFVNFYNDLFLSNFNNHSYPFPDDLSGLFNPVLNIEDNVALTSIPSMALIKKTLFSFASHKSPGPDGLPPTFFKNFWDTTNLALVQAVQHFFNSGHMLKALNSTFIALIPKNKKTSRVDHCRPISLCNATCKTIAKIIAQTVKSFLNKCISSNQLAFVSGRSIHDNYIVTHEIMNYLHKKKGPKGFMAIKVDLAKAFDRVEWNLLICILSQLGFDPIFINWIHECISTTSLSFLINGSPFGNIKPSRGIRQGDPMSPFLYVLYFEILSRLLAREEMLNNFKGVKVSRTSPSVSHLLFADDLVIFCRSTIEDASCIKRTLDTISLSSSQLPNNDKSMVHFSSNTLSQTKYNILDILCFKECTHNIKHLGLSFCVAYPRKIAFKDTSHKISSCLKGWTAKTLSQASRSILIKVVAQAIPTYPMSITLLPKDLYHNLDALMRKFWCGENEKGNSLMLKCWDAICSP